MRRNARTLAPVLCAAAVLLACGAGEGDSDAQQESAERVGDVAADSGAVAQPDQESPVMTDRESRSEAEHARGRIMITGSEPMVTVSLAIEGESAVNLTGQLLPELRRLSGATVEVYGTRTGTAPMARFDVVEYEVGEIDGLKPVVGMLRESGGAYRITSGEDETTLAAVPREMSGLAGAKVWVTGVWEGGMLRVQSYGVIREP